MPWTGRRKNTCTIRRATTTTNDKNQPVESLSDLATGVRCNLVEKSSKEIFADSEKVIHKYDLVLPYGTDIKAEDKVVIDGTTYDVEYVNTFDECPRHDVIASLTRNAL